MGRSPLGTLVALAIVAAVVMALMWLFSLRQVTDTSTNEAAQEVDAALERSLEPGVPSRVTMTRVGKGLDAPRHYVLRYRPSAAVAGSPQALTVLAERAASLVLAQIQARRAEVTIHCVAELRDGKTSRACFRRQPVGPPDGEQLWELVPVVPLPPLPSESGEADPAKEDSK